MTPTPMRHVSPGSSLSAALTPTRGCYAVETAARASTQRCCRGNSHLDVAAGIEVLRVVTFLALLQDVLEMFLDHLSQVLLKKW